MSYEGTICPCGDKKLPDTMLCDKCEMAFADHPSMLSYKDKSKDIESRRFAATTLLALSRGRKRNQNEHR
jgi:hypothetical protein